MQIETIDEAVRRVRSGELSPMDVPWFPFERAHMDSLFLDGVQFHQCWMNSRYQVLVRFLPPEQMPPGWPPMAWLSIKSLDKESHHSWRDFQRIKNELCGTRSEAVELYPDERRLVDGANQYHLWALHPAVGGFPFGSTARNVETPGQAADEGARQAVFQPHHNAEGCTEEGIIGWPDISGWLNEEEE